MNDDILSKPALTEPGMKFFLGHTLKQCNITKNKFHNLMFNLGLLVSFLLVLGFILLYKYKGKITPIEKDRKNNQKQQYILSKIKTFQETKKRAHQELITGLPNWDSEFEAIQKKNVF